MRTVRLAFAAILVAVLIGGSAPALGGFTVPEPPSDPRTLVLRINLWPTYGTPRLPGFNMYGGGRVIMDHGPEGSAVRGYELQLSPERYRQVYQQAHVAGLARSRHLPEPRMSSESTLLVAELLSGGRLHTTTALSPDRYPESRARRILIDFRASLSELGSIPGTPYLPDRVAVLVTDVSGSGTATEPWPGGDVTGGLLTSQGRCTIRDGAETWELARATPADSRWFSPDDPRGVEIAVRPMLPDEDGCADLNRPPIW